MRNPTPPADGPYKAIQHPEQTLREYYTIISSIQGDEIEGPAYGIFESAIQAAIFARVMNDAFAAGQAEGAKRAP